MHADVAHQALEPFAQVEELAHLVFLALTLGEQRLHLARHLEGDRLVRLHRYELRQLVAEVVAEVKHPAAVAQHGARRQRAEGRDLRNALSAVFVPDVIDHAVAPVLAKVDVEVRHRDALGIEKALEQQVVAQRIEIGDAERVGDQRSRAGSPAGAHRNAVRSCPADEVGDDEEVAGKAHLHDGADLESEPLAVACSGVAFQAELLQPARKAGLGRVLEVLVDAHARRRWEGRQAALAQLDLQVAAPRDLHRVVERLRQIGEELHHLGTALEVLLRGEQLRPALIAEHVALRDADARLVRLEVLGLEELHRMRRRHRQADARRQRDRARQCATAQCQSISGDCIRRCRLPLQARSTQAAPQWSATSSGSGPASALASPAIRQSRHLLTSSELDAS